MGRLIAPPRILARVESVRGTLPGPVRLIELPRSGFTREEEQEIVAHFPEATIRFHTKVNGMQGVMGSGALGGGMAPR